MSAAISLGKMASCTSVDTLRRCNGLPPSEKDTANNELEKRLWQAADQLRANSGLMIYIYDEKGRQTGSTPAR